MPIVANDKLNKAKLISAKLTLSKAKAKVTFMQRCAKRAMPKATPHAYFSKANLSEPKADQTKNAPKPV